MTLKVSLESSHNLNRSNPRPNQAVLSLEKIYLCPFTNTEELSILILFACPMRMEISVMQGIAPYWYSPLCMHAELRRTSTWEELMIFSRISLSGK